MLELSPKELLLGVVIAVVRVQSNLQASYNKIFQVRYTQSEIADRKLHLRQLSVSETTH